MKKRNRINNRLLAGVSLAVVMSATIISSHAQVNYADTFYNDGGYTYCDAKLLASFWNESIYDAKVQAGQKVANGFDVTVKEQLREARDNAARNNIRCTWEDGDNPQYTYEDAEKLAVYWGENSPWDAKLKIGRLLQEGLNDAIISALQRAS